MKEFYKSTGLNKINFLLAYVFFALAFATACTQPPEANLQITSCVDQDGERLTGIAEVRINGIVHQVNCSGVHTIIYQITGEQVPLRFSEGTMPGYTLISPRETVPIGLNGLDVELAFRSTEKMAHIVINTCMQTDSRRVEEQLQFIVDGKTYIINCPDGKRIFVDRETAETENGVPYAVIGDGFIYRGEKNIVFQENQNEYFLTLLLEPTANLSIVNVPVSSSLSLQMRGESNVQVFDNQQLIENLPVGLYEFQITAAGYENMQGQIQLNRGNNRIEFAAAEIIQTGTLTVGLQPSSANAVIRSSQNTDRWDITDSKRDIALTLGEYTWSAAAEGYEPQSGRFRITEGQNNLNINLYPFRVTGELVISVTPLNANVTLTNITTNDVISASADELLEIAPGEYSYSVELPGFVARRGAIEVYAGRTASITARLNEVSILSFIDEMELVSGVREASQLIRSKPSESPALSPENRVRYHNELYRLSVILYEAGDIMDAVEVFEYLVSEDNANFQARLALGNHFVRNASNQTELEQAREYIRPMFGSMRFNYPPSDRLRVELTARYFYALSYYEEIALTRDQDRRGVIARQAISQLRDSHARFMDAPALSSELQNYMNDTANLIQVIEADILFGIN